MTKQLRLYQSSVIWETCFLLAKVVNWLQSRTANRLRASSANYSLSTPIAVCHVFDQRSSVFNLCTATCSRNMGNDWLHFVAALQRNDRAMMCLICNFKANDQVSSDSLLSKPRLQYIDVVLRPSKRWYGHVERI